MTRERNFIRFEDVEWLKTGDLRYKVSTSKELNEADLSFGIAELTPGGVHSLHHHEDTSELYYVLEGKAKITVGKGTAEATRGTTIYIPAKTKHKVVNDGKENFVFVWVLNLPEIDKLINVPDE